MKQTDYLRFCRDEVDRSKQWRSDNYDDLWHRMIDLYRGKQYASRLDRNDRLVVNLVFATKNVIAPSVAINNPRFVVNARKPENAPERDHRRRSPQLPVALPQLPGRDPPRRRRLDHHRARLGQVRLQFVKPPEVEDVR